MSQAVLLEKPHPIDADIGVLVHGRNLHSPDIGRMLLGQFPNELGTIPTAVLTILDAGPERVRGMYLGSGASERQDETGAMIPEALYIKRLMLNGLNAMSQHDLIREHPNMQAADKRQRLGRVVTEAVADVTAKNTEQEISRAAMLFAAVGVKKVIQVTSASHGPRCLQLQNEARQDGTIPDDQRWSVVSDDVPYPFARVVDTVVVEPPHQGEPESALPMDLWLASLARDYYSLTPEARCILAFNMRQFMNDPQNTRETPLESQFGLAGIVMAIAEKAWSTHPQNPLAHSHKTDSIE
jgi:hypothetical protein